MTVALNENDTKMMRDMIRSNIIDLLYNKPLDKKKTKRIFLTQLNDRIEEEEENQNLVQANLKHKNTSEKSKESSILKHGSQFKLQQNILAQRLVDEKEVTKSLIEKRQEFEKRIEFCKDRQDQLVHKQEQHSQLVKKYSQFINEKETIRKRAVVKYQTELRTRMQKMLEYDMLLQEFERIRSKHERFTFNVEKRKKYKDFLTKVISMLPDNYLEAGESKYLSLMMRHQTLYEFNFDLFENLIANSDKLKALRNEYEKLVLEHNSNIMTINSKLGELQQIKDQLNLKNTRVEELLWQNGDKKRNEIIDVSKVLWAIDNLAEKSIDKFRLAVRPLNTMSIFDKLETIQGYILKQTEIIKMVEGSNS